MWSLFSLFFCFCSSFFFFSLPLGTAQATTRVQAFSDSKVVGVGQSFVFKIQVNFEGSISLTPPKLPPLDGLSLQSEWSQSQTRSSMVSTAQGMDLKIIQTRTFNYQLLAEQRGQWTLPSLSVEVDGKIYKTQPVDITVKEKVPRKSPGKSFPPSSSHGVLDSMEEHFNQLLQRHLSPGFGGAFQTAPPLGKDVFFIIAQVDQTEAYKGEAIVASWYIYTRGNLRDIDTLKYPSLKGFWKEDIKIAQVLNFERVNFRGQPYRRALLASYALFPIEVGTVSIDPYKAKAAFVGSLGRSFVATKSSKSIPIRVKELPVEGKPRDFTGAVGTFQMSARVQRGTVVTGQPFSLKIRFEGRGNAKVIELPALNLENQGVEVYDIKNESRFFKNGQSFKEFEVLLIPSKVGSLVLGPFRTHFFDPQKETYMSLETQPISVNVLRGTAQESLGEDRIQTAKKQLPPPISYWDPKLKGQGGSFYLWLWALGVSFLVLGVRVIYKLGWGRRKITLEDQVRRQMKILSQKVASKDWSALGVEVTNLVYRVMGEVSGLGGASDKLEKIWTQTSPSVRRQIEEPLKSHMEYFSAMGFAPKQWVQNLDEKQKEVLSKLKSLEKLLIMAIRLNKK